jgi:hypothetical protein
MIKERERTKSALDIYNETNDLNEKQAFQEFI